MRTVHVTKAEPTVGPIESIALAVDLQHPELEGLEEAQEHYRRESAQVMAVLAAMPQGLRYQLLLRMLEAAPVLYCGPVHAVERGATEWLPWRRSTSDLATDIRGKLEPLEVDALARDLAAPADDYVARAGGGRGPLTTEMLAGEILQWAIDTPEVYSPGVLTGGQYREKLAERLIRQLGLRR